MSEICHTTFNGPKIIMENVFPNCLDNKEEDTDYEAHDIDFRTATLVAPNLNRQTSITSEVSFAIDSIDVVTYCTPKDVLPS